MSNYALFGLPSFFLNKFGFRIYNFNPNLSLIILKCIEWTKVDGVDQGGSNWTEMIEWTIVDLKDQSRHCWTEMD